MSICRACKQPIASDASKCPHCQSYQNWWKNPRFWPMMIALPIIFFFSFLPLFSTRHLLEHTDYNNQLAASISKQTLTTSDNAYNGEKTDIIVIGSIHNNSNIKWSGITYETKLFNAKGELLDILAHQDYGQVFLPNSDTEFRLAQKSVANAKDVAKVEVKVKDASEKKF